MVIGRGYRFSLKNGDKMSDEECGTTAAARVAHYLVKSLSMKLKEPHIILGIFYFALGFGILLGWIIHAFILVFDLLPDALVFTIMNVSGMIPEEDILRIQDPTLAIFPYEITIHYILSIFSFLGFTSLIMGLRFMILYANKSHTTSLKMFITGLADCFIVGFTTFMPLFL